MRTAGNIIVYSFWFAFVVWLSFWFLAVPGWVLEKLPLDFARLTGIPGYFVLWCGFVCLLAWLPIWVMKRRGLEIAQKPKRNAFFVSLLLGCTILCTIAWGMFIDGTLYNCTDSLDLDFLHPGDWIHGKYVTVPQINPRDSMSMPDSIKEGWSVPKLWLLWWSFVAVSVAISASLASLICWRKKPTD